MIILATGSEVEIAVKAAALLKQQSIDVRVVSMPCCDLFKLQDAAYQQQVLPKEVKARVAIEAATSDYWHQFVGDQGEVLGLNQFGASAPAAELFEHYQLTAEKISAMVIEMVALVV